MPVRGFGLVWQDHPEAQGLVGCPTGAEAAIGVVSEPFEHGWMVQLSSPVPGQTAARTVYVLFGDDATVAQVPDTWAATDPIPTGQTPPAGLVAPVRDFGKVWRDGTDLKIRQRLGWAEEPEKGAVGAWQPYQQGLMIWTPEPKQIFVVGQQGPTGGGPNAWRLYPDLFAG